MRARAHGIISHVCLSYTHPYTIQTHTIIEREKGRKSRKNKRREEKEKEERKREEREIIGRGEKESLKLHIEEPIHHFWSLELGKSKP